jgi:hypothetical protein
MSSKEANIISIFIPKKKLQQFVDAYINKNYNNELVDKFQRNEWIGNWSDDKEMFIIQLSDDNLSKENEMIVLRAENKQLKDKVSLLETKTEAIDRRCACYRNNMKLCKKTKRGC